MIVKYTHEAHQTPNSHYENRTETYCLTKTLTYAPLKQDEDLAKKQDSIAEKCLEEFLQKGGAFQHVSLATTQSKITLQAGDAVYPVCAGGFCRSQALWAILQQFSNEIVLFPPHAARHGWDPYNGRINRHRNYSQENVHDEFAQYFNRDKAQRFGFEYTHEWESFEMNPTEEGLKQISEFYTQHYFGPNSACQGKRRIYIAFSNNAHVILYRLNQTNCDLRNVKVIAIDSDDIITSPPGFLKTTPRSVKAYEHFSKLLNNLFAIEN